MVVSGLVLPAAWPVNVRTGPSECDANAPPSVRVNRIFRDAAEDACIGALSPDSEQQDALSVIVRETPIAGLLVLEPSRHRDSRGCFAETWSSRTFAGLGLPTGFVQDNLSLSHRVGTVRGLHCQAPPHAQGKLVRCAHGALTDVAVDVRRGSATYGQHVMVDLTAANGRQLWIPAGFLHGFVTRQPDTELAYKCTAAYDAGSERVVRWDSLGIDWGLDRSPTLSERDATAPAFADFDSPFHTADREKETLACAS